MIVRSFLLPISLIFLGLVASGAGSGPYQQPSQTVPGQSLPQTEPAPEPAQNQNDTIRLSSRLVLVPVSVSDASGQPVKDLKPQDVVIEEDGRPQQVVSLGEPGQTPIDLVLLFDVSGSTHKQFEFEQQAAIQFIKNDLKPGDAVSLFSIGLTPKMVEPRTNSVADAIAGLTSIAPSNEPTAFFDAMVEGVRYLGKTADSGSRRVILVISDGEENYSKTSTLRDALRELLEKDCIFYSINPNGQGINLNKTSLQGQTVMEAMASQTGGKAFSISKPEDLGYAFNQIAAELQAQYLFGYYVSDEATNGSFKKITVRSPGRPDLRIRARQGYYALQPKP
jgi:Ca-activated chloride channel family protein